MKADDLPLGTVLVERQQWVVPVYQRQYAWDRYLVEQLWEDIDHIADTYIETGKIVPHFVGAVIYAKDDSEGFGRISPKYIVDGQQRLTTFHLFLAALLDHAKVKKNAIFKARLEEYLFNPITAAMEDPKRDKHKLWSSSQDRKNYLTLAERGIEGLREEHPQAFKANGEIYKTDNSYTVPKMIRAYALIREGIEEYFDFWSDSEESDDDESSPTISQDQVFEALLTAVLKSMIVVIIELGKDDDARAIFASLNGQSEPLSAFDLIRNDIFHRAVKRGESEEELYHGPWKALEGEYWQKEVKQGRMKRARVDHFMAHMLTAVTGDDVSAADVATEYSAYANDAEFESVAHEINAVMAYASVYERYDSEEPSYPEDRIGRFMKAWDMSVFHPLVLAIGVLEISDEEKRILYKRIEDYVVRRDVSGLTRKNLNKNVVSLLKHMTRHDFSLFSMEEWFTGAEGQGSLMPMRSDILTGATELNAYDNLKPRKLRYILHGIEMDLRTANQEHIIFETDNLHVEHILPQKWAKNWPLPSGLIARSELWNTHVQLRSAAVEIGNEDELSQSEIAAFGKREKSKNTLGNLTLLTSALNPSVGNGAWEEKRGSKGIGKSILLLNREAIEIQSWDEESILNRSELLADRIDRLWPSNLSS